jgi:NADPH:quinone reductase-like Zn-dependent oxidoreductase
MRAVTIDDFGANPTVTDAARPVAGPGEILVRVRASSLNGFDRAVIAGAFKDMLEHRFPITLGKDFAGTVEAVGEGVNRAVGDRVFGVVMTPVVSEGSFAEYVVVSEGNGIAAILDGLDFAQAGALGLAGTAAVTVIDAIAPAAGETVLIAGATGGVGAHAVQLAAATGATVIATARPGQEAEFTRGLGATHVVDYTHDLVEQVRAIAPNGVTAAAHLAGDPTQLTDLLAAGGRLASTLGYGAEHAQGRDITITSVLANPDPATLQRLAHATASGTMHVTINDTYPLEAAAQAFHAFDTGTLGKIAITID